MTEAYKIWATLDLKGNAAEKMGKFAEITKLANKEVMGLNERMRALSSQYENKFSSLLKKINPVYRAIETSGTASFKALNMVMDESINRVHALIAANEKLILSQRKVGRMSAPHINAEIPAAPKMKMHRGNFHFGPHAMHAVGLGEMAAPLAMMRGGGMAGAAVGGLAYLTYKGFQQHQQFERGIMQLRAQNVSKRDILFDKDIANKIRAGISQNDMLQALIDSHMATRDPKEARKLAPILAMGKFAMEATYGRIMTDNQMQQAVKVAEMRGGSNPSKQAQALELVFKMMATSGGSILPSQLSAFYRRASAVSQRVTNMGFLKLEPVIQEYSGTSTGTAYRTLSNLLVGGIGMTNNKADILTKMGLMNGIKYSKSGRVMGTKYGAFDKKMENLLQTDPIAFELQFKKIAEQKLGIKTDAAYQKLLISTFGSLPSNLMALIDKNIVKEERAARIGKHLPGIEVMYKQAIKSDPGAPIRLEKAWQSFAKAIGEVSSPAVIGGLDLISRALETFAKILSTPNAFNPYKEARQGIEKITDKVHPVKSLESIIYKYTHAGTNHPSTSPPPQVHQQVPVQVNLHIHGKKFASAMIPHLSSALQKGATISSTTGVNIGLTPIPTSFNNVG